MKWFKHMSDASDDAFIEGLEDKFGWEGYGRWWKLLEVIASDMEKNDQPFSEHSWVKWQTFLKGKRNKLETFLVHCQNELKIKLEQNGNILRITCDKLLELRDEYSRKSGQTPDNTPDKLPAKTKERRTKTKEKEITSSEVIEKIHPYPEKFEVFWKEYPKNAASKAEAFKSYNRALDSTSAEEILSAVAPYRDYLQASDTPVAHATTWLNQQRWSVDYPSLCAKRDPPGRPNPYATTVNMKSILDKVFPDADPGILPENLSGKADHH